MEKIQNLLDKGEIVYKKANDVPKPAVMMVSHDTLAAKDNHCQEEIEAKISISRAMSNSSPDDEASTSTLVTTVEVPPLPSPSKEEVIYDVIKHMRKVPALVSMFDALCMSPASRSLLEHALAEVASKHGGAQTFFQQSQGIKDYVTDVEYLGRPLPVLTKVNKEQRSRTISAWPHIDDVLALPNGVITFSNEDLCHPEPNHNRPLFVSVEHRSKVIRRALVDQGGSINILPLRVLKELGYSAEDLTPTDTQISSVSPTTCDSMGTISLHISVGPLSMQHLFHVIDLDPVFHMLLARPWIHDHRCVPSSWHQCIKAAPLKGNQIRIRGLQNPFLLKEAHFFEAGFFLSGNVLVQARQKATAHVYPATMPLPDFIMPTTNCPPPLPPEKTNEDAVLLTSEFTPSLRLVFDDVDVGLRGGAGSHEDVGNGYYDLMTVDGDDIFRVNAKYLKLWRDPATGGHGPE